MRRMMGDRVQIVGGMKEFHGATGRVVGAERLGEIMYRVELDAPVTVPGVGRVTDDLWAARYLKAVRG